MYSIKKPNIDFTLGLPRKIQSPDCKNINNKFYGGTSSLYTNDWELFLFIACSSYPQAIRLERHIKSMKSTSYISNLAKYPEMIEKLVKKYS